MARHTVGSLPVEEGPGALVREVLGKPSVHPALLALAKTCTAFSFVVLALRLAGFDLLGVTFHAARWPAAVVMGAGCTVIVIALAQLNEAARVGLPTGRTSLKTSGLYAFSRNPIYLSAAVMLIASCIYVPHSLNVISTVATILIHHSIVLAEERFLAERFGAAWDDYRRKVRRY